MDLRDRALKLYHPPFRYERGYVYDSRDNMVLDQVALDVTESGLDVPERGITGDQVRRVLRIRGWGRMVYMHDAAELQDEVGRLVALALTDAWRRGLRGVDL